MGLLKRGRLIKRYDLPAVYREIVTTIDPDNYIDNKVESYIFTKFIITGCTLQPLKDWQYQQVLGGSTSDQAYSVVTDSPLTAPTDGSPDIGCSVYIPNTFFSYDVPAGFPVFDNQGGWYRVIQPKNSFNGTQNNCVAYLVKDSTPLDNQGKEKYPDMTDVESGTKTRSALLGGAWKTDYLSP